MCDSNGLQKQEPLNAMMQLYQARGEIELLKERILHADAEINRVVKESDGFKKQVEVLLKRIVQEGNGGFYININTLRKWSIEKAKEGTRQTLSDVVRI
jgi:hypothetical protein